MTARSLRTLLGAAGAALIGYGLYGLLTDPQIHDPADVLLWGVGAIVLHDGLWAPLLCLVGAVLTRRHPLLRGALLVTAALLAVGLPAVLRGGDDHGNASLLPLPYLRNLLILLGVVVVVTLAVAVVRRLRRQAPGRRSERRPGAPRRGRPTASSGRSRPP